jgi:hypothetical protein
MLASGQAIKFDADFEIGGSAIIAGLRVVSRNMASGIDWYILTVLYP